MLLLASGVLVSFMTKSAYFYQVRHSRYKHSTNYVISRRKKLCMKNYMCMKNMISITVHFSVSLIFPRFRLSAKLPLRGALTWTWDTDSWQCVLLIKINFRVNLQVSFPFYTAAYSQCLYQDFHFLKATFQQRQGRSRSFCELSSLQQEEVFYILGFFIFSSLQVF